MYDQETVIEVEHGPGYMIQRFRDGATTIACTACKLVSPHPVDVQHLYCARCRAFHAADGPAPGYTG
jgi:hypothetical protein